MATERSDIPTHGVTELGWDKWSRPNSQSAANCGNRVSLDSFEMFSAQLLTGSFRLIQVRASLIAAESK